MYVHTYVRLFRISEYWPSHVWGGFLCFRFTHTHTLWYSSNLYGRYLSIRDPGSSLSAVYFSPTWQHSHTHTLAQTPMFQEDFLDPSRVPHFPMPVKKMCFFNLKPASGGLKRIGVRGVRMFSSKLDPRILLK